jgi:hypothetical protein
MGLPHLEHARIPISERLDSGLGCADGMIAGPRSGGSSILSVTETADKGAVMKPACSSSSELSGHYCSPFEIKITFVRSEYGNFDCRNE